MNRAERRRAARIKHDLVEWPRRKPMPLPIALSEDQKAWTCSCGSGWFSISNERPVESHAAHVVDARGVKAEA